MALAELEKMSKQTYISPYCLAVVYVGIQDKDKTLTWLKKHFKRGLPG
jgi:hypothetical protein